MAKIIGVTKTHPNILLDNLIKVEKMYSRPYKSYVKFTLLMAYLLHANHATAQTALWAGGGLISGGDDRILPQLSLGSRIGQSYYAEALFAGQRYSIASKQTQILSTGVYFDKLGSLPSRLKAVLGLTLFREATQISSATVASKPNEAAKAKQSDTSYNAGLHIGLRLEFLKINGFFATINWDSHLFPAGLAVIFLSTGRRQVVTLSAGVEL